MDLNLPVAHEAAIGLTEPSVSKAFVKITGGKPLHGTVTPDGAKNSALIQLAAMPLVEDTWVKIDNLPGITDVDVSIEMLRECGLTCKREKNAVTVIGNAKKYAFSEENGSRIRSSIAFLGSVLSRFGRVRLPLPGGDAIGDRPIDIHLDVLRAFQIDARVENGCVVAEARKFPLEGAEIFLRYPSVLATVNAILLAVKATGKTVIVNAAKEPEIIDLASLLSKMGAHVIGAGTERIIVRGVERLNGAEYQVMPDRLETGALLMAIVMSGGSGKITGTIPEHVLPLVHTLRDCGVDIQIDDATIEIKSVQLNKGFQISTAPYPGFATDLQPIITPLALVAPGESAITDTVFPERFGHVSELRKFGADIKRNGNTIWVHGLEPLSGCEVAGGDIRSVVCLINTALSVGTETKVFGVEHLLRGHARFVDKLKSLEAQIDYSSAL
ncbi:MAG: UDP-N-acetylglucosamine 1-carboxyvinyltransferase [Clostridiales bacterium]|jgi:UDP-N-acetylglucosamine 1-carboxyvinyltransferase|nr:UDP-N-acetylglucosamine 1-carboxyvinyltransferase [Clostridiales bacterium]